MLSCAFVVKKPETEQDSILQNKKRVNDSLYIKILDKQGVLRMEYLRPRAKTIMGKVKIYDKFGRLKSIESYHHGFHHKFSENFIAIHRYPLRMGVWEYFNKQGAIKRSVTYRLLMDNNISDFHMLVREIKFNTHNGNKSVKVRKEYTETIQDLELGLKRIKFGRPFYTARGKKL